MSISIPAIGLYHSVSARGLTGGVLEPPSGVIQWYTGSPKPGTNGISVIAGHVSWNGPDVFWRMPRIPVGAKITIGYSNGQSKTFTVYSKASINKNSMQHDVRVWGRSATPVLALVSCDSSSAWVGGGHHANNYVVWAR